MNLLIINPENINCGTAVISDRKRILHIREILKKSGPGSNIRIGILNSGTGSGEITEMDDNRLELKISLDGNPPDPVKLKLVIAVPRPKIFRRVLQYGTSLGIKEFHFVRTWKTDKSYLLSPELSDKNIYRNLVTGLEQAKDTMLPEVSVHPLFRPFAEDRLPEIAADTRKITAHPGGKKFTRLPGRQGYTLAVGPEGGFTEFETFLLESAGFTSVEFGTRILRVETAISYIAGKLFD